MKIKTIKKEIVIGIAVVLVFTAAIAGSQIYRRIKNRGDLASRIAEMGGGGPPETIEGLRTAIAAYEEQIEAHVRDAAQTGVYYKILAVRLQDRGLFNEALDALERAIHYNPDDATLHYLAGLSLGVKAKTFTTFTTADRVQRENFLALAEESYLRAILLNERYLRPRYGLGILYVFEMDRPEDAVPHLEFYLDIRRNDIEVMFVLARAYYMTGVFELALDMYDRIISVTKDAAKKTEAQNNRRIVLEMMNG